MWQGSFTVEKIQPELDYWQKGIRTELDSYCYKSTEEERPAAWGGHKKGEAEQEVIGGYLEECARVRIVVEYYFN